MKRYPENDKYTEKAIEFMVFAVRTSGRNPKPVILHSIKVGMHLYDLGFVKDVVIGGILHDLIEDTDTKIKEIEAEFGKNVSELVLANTFDESIKDKTERYKENFERCRKAGKVALIIKTADFYDNVDYYHLASTNELKEWLIEKLRYFIKSMENTLKDENIYRELIKKYKNLPFVK